MPMPTSQPFPRVNDAAWQRRRLGLLVLLGLGAPVNVFAGAADDVPADRLAAILARALAYDSSLAKRAGVAVDIGILIPPDAPATHATLKKVVEGFRGIRDIRVGGLPMHVHEIVTDNLETLEAAIEHDHLDALFLTLAPGPERERVLRLCTAKNVLTMTNDRAAVEAGVAIGVAMFQEKPKIFINNVASKATGVMFMTDLLRIATVIKEPEVTP